MKNCLVVDDSRVIRKVARRILEELAFSIEEAADGQEALDACRAGMPDAILLDWNMPVMSGIDFLRALRREPGAPIGCFLERLSKTDRSGLLSALEYVLRSRELAA